MRVCLLCVSLLLWKGVCAMAWPWRCAHSAFFLLDLTTTIPNPIPMSHPQCDMALRHTTGKMRNYERDLPQRDERHALRQHLGEFHCSLCTEVVPIEAASGKGKQLATQCRCMRRPVCRSPMSHRAKTSTTQPHLKD